jgi:GH25 family lysozyme M1 (1,4-beta-N-acetylmuramidase)/Tfp pilus assembly protein PilV
MKLEDEYYEEEHGSGSKITYAYMVLIMSVIILGVTALVFYVNQSNNKSDGSGYAAAVAQKEAKEAEASQKSSDANSITSSTDKLTSDQLDIWTLPDTGRTKTQSGSNNGTVTNKSTGETVSESSSDKSTDDNVQTADELANGKTAIYDITEKESASEEVEESEKSEEDEEATSITVRLSDGTKEEVDLDEDIDRNTYDYSNLTSKSPLMTYSVDGNVVSTCGVDISANSGEVDFSKLKSAGVDFVMIKIGARGYSSGNIVMDENYEDNLAAAKKAGLDIGVYFCSQAVSKSEAKEEADVVLDAIEKYTIKYPVAYVMENVTDDMARIEALDTSERTQMAKSFMDRVENSGYTPILYGDLEWLMTYVDMSKLDDYDVWYAQDSSKPDFPYEFTMWQYSSSATIKGIDSKATMILSFKDYAD